MTAVVTHDVPGVVRIQYEAAGTMGGHIGTRFTFVTDAEAASIRDGLIDLLYPDLPARGFLQWREQHSIAYGRIIGVITGLRYGSGESVLTTDEVIALLENILTP